LNKRKIGVILSETGSRFQYLGTRTAIELILKDSSAFILYRPSLLFLLLRVDAHPWYE